MQFWKTLIQKTTQVNVVLLLVVDSIGSSPGRQGFKMLVTPNEIWGSIGGGVMEHQLVEEAKTMLQTAFKPFYKKQIHKGKVQDGSGMICSGEQTVLFCFLGEKELAVIEKMILTKGLLNITNNGFSLENKKVNFNYKWETTANDWSYQEQLFSKEQLYIFGAGHVGFALSKLACNLDFTIHLFDNRDRLNTFEQNTFADYKTILSYDDVLPYVSINKQAYIVIMTNSYVADKLILAQFIKTNPKYIGVLGSQAKINTMFSVLKSEGYNQDEISTIHAPIGLKIHSKTPEEIAISILAELVRVKNG